MTNKEVKEYIMNNLDNYAKINKLSISDAIIKNIVFIII